MMLLTIDCGNTNITLGIFNDDKLCAVYRLITADAKTADEYGSVILTFLALNGMEKTAVTAVIIASVVPKLNNALREGIERYLHLKPLFIDYRLKYNLELHYAHPQEIGADRLAIAAAAHHFYPGDLLVIDFGTATTFEYISQKGGYYGGCICPGVKISADALIGKAAKLPEITLAAPQSVLADNTVAAMQAGIYYGYLGAVEYLITKYQATTGKKLKVIATGGLGKVFSQASDKIDIYDEDLILKGLKLINDLNRPAA